jgi:hypothetical protein
MSFRSMRPTPPDGIMDIVAQPLSKNAVGKDKKEEASVSSEPEENKALG